MISHLIDRRSIEPGFVEQEAIIILDAKFGTKDLIGLRDDCEKLMLIFIWDASINYFFYVLMKHRASLFIKCVSNFQN